MKTLRIQRRYIQKQSLQQLLTEYLFVFPLFVAILTEFLGLPSFLKYTADVAWVGLLALSLAKGRMVLKKSTLPMLCITIGFFLLTLIVYGFRFQSPAYYLWGFRNNFRYYVAFFAFAAFLNQEDVDNWFAFFDKLFWINVVVSLVQFLFLGYEQDYLGGIFGVGLGCNANTLVFFIVVLTRSVLQMMTGERTTAHCVAHVLAASVIAALAELKVFFLMLMMILLLAAAMTKFSWKKCFLLIFMVICFFMGSSILVLVFGSSSRLSLDNILRLVFAESYSSSNDLSRMNAIKVISSTILTNPLGRLFGLGLGNCDTSAFAVCNTPFFQTHSYLHYTWFSRAFLFLETGYIGLGLYTAFFLACLLMAIWQMRKGRCSQLYGKFAIIIALQCAVLTVYNSSLRLDIAYIVYFSLATPFVNGNKRTEQSK